MACTEPIETPIRNAEITAHELLDDDQKRLVRTFRSLAKKRGESFAWLDFAQVSLRAASREYATACDDEQGTGRVTKQVMADSDLRKAAVLYVFEALRATELHIIREWEGYDEMLRSLEYLAGDLP